IRRSGRSLIALCATPFLFLGSSLTPPLGFSSLNLGSLPSQYLSPQTREDTQRGSTRVEPVEQMPWFL
ncbi:MAG: hypothetical protein LDL31_00680, partial [Prosthecobacter sp.]|nr:hypothetical protein [Prosthecobacter sp.]